jgi:hypothetical protein
MRWILLLALLFAAAFAEAQERFQSYTTDNGLPNNSAAQEAGACGYALKLNLLDLAQQVRSLAAESA